MSGKRYTDEFKIEAVKQVTERNYKLSDVADRSGVTSKSLHAWVARYDNSGNQRQAIDTQLDEIRQLKAQLRR
jgi:transposase